MPTTAKPFSALTDQIQRQLDSIVEMAVQVDRSGVTHVPLRSHWTVAGLLNHQRYVIRFWVANVVVGADLPVPWTDDSPHEDWNADPEVTIETFVDALRQEWKDALSLLAAYQPGELASQADDDGNRPTVDWVLSHLLAEVARHAGHMDAVCEILKLSPAE
ncbi:mycothiol transferase [Brevibacterium paucivorans]